MRCKSTQVSPKEGARYSRIRILFMKEKKPLRQLIKSRYKEFCKKSD